MLEDLFIQKVSILRHTIFALVSSCQSAVHAGFEISNLYIELAGIL